jgi:hypothetical protein
MTDSATPVPGKDEQGPFVDLDAVALPAAGAFTNQAYVRIPPESRRASIIATVALGAGATTNQARFRLQWQIDGGGGPLSDVAEVVLDGTTVAKVNPYLQNPEYAYEVAGPIVAAGLSWRLLSVEVPIKAIGIRVIAAEVGDTAHPSVMTTRVYTSREV